MAWNPQKQGGHWEGRICCTPSDSPSAAVPLVGAEFLVAAELELPTKLSTEWDPPAQIVVPQVDFTGLCQKATLNRHASLEIVVTKVKSS